VRATTRGHRFTGSILNAADALPVSATVIPTATRAPAHHATC
jgi:hypothetical protein